MTCELNLVFVALSMAVGMVLGACMRMDRRRRRLYRRPDLMADIPRADIPRAYDLDTPEGRAGFEARARRFDGEGRP
jgi:hypothetical protein